MQSKQELEQFYNTKDPWGYETNVDDLKRKNIIISLLEDKHFKTALDIGAGEGFITKDLPADEIYGLEISDIASSRFPSNVKRVLDVDREYDLVITTGTLYTQYDREQILNWIKKANPKVLIIAGIKSWLPVLPTPTKEVEFHYREYTQIIKFYESNPFA